MITNWEYIFIILLSSISWPKCIKCPLSQLDSEAIILSETGIGPLLVQLRALSQYHASPSDTLSRQCPFDLYNLDKYILEFEPIHLAIWTNTFNNWDKYILQFGQIHLAIWTNTFCNCRPSYPSITLSRQCPFDLWAMPRIKWTLLMRWEFELHVIMIILHMLPPRIL